MKLTPEQLIEQLAEKGGVLVTSGECSVMEIAVAEASGRFAVNANGIGFVLRPKDKAVTSGEIGALGLVADLREALGDPQGRLMQPELIERCREMRALLYSARCIADRSGAGTAWARFSAAIGRLNINGITARTYRVLPDDQK